MTDFVQYRYCSGTVGTRQSISVSISHLHAANEYTWRHDGKVPVLQPWPTNSQIGYSLGISHITNLSPHIFRQHLISLAAAFTFYYDILDPNPLGSVNFELPGNGSVINIRWDYRFFPFPPLLCCQN